MKVPRLDLIWQETSGGWQRSSRRKKKCNQCNDCAPPPTNTIHRFRKDFRAMTNTSYKKTWPISPHNNELTSLKECPFNFNLEFQTRPVLIPCSMMSHHIHSVPRGIFIPSDLTFHISWSTYCSSLVRRGKKGAPPL